MKPIKSYILLFLIFVVVATVAAYYDYFGLSVVSVILSAFFVGEAMTDD